jgi:hypothetical protein
MYFFRLTAYSASVKIEAEVPPKQQLPNLHGIVIQKTAILTMKTPLENVFVSKVIFNWPEGLRNDFSCPST